MQILFKIDGLLFSEFTSADALIDFGVNGHLKNGVPE